MNIYLIFSSDLFWDIPNFNHYSIVYRDMVFTEADSN